MPVAELGKASEFRASICKSSFWQFVRQFWQCVPGAGKLVENWHMEYIANVMQEVMERAFKRLPKLYDVVINISPGTSKSSIASILFPAWCWAREPSTRVLSASHTETLVLDLATKARDVINSERYQEAFPYIELVKDQASKGYYRNTLGGDRYTCTVSGKSPMGMHALVQLVDDPIDPKAVLSEADMKTAREFMTDVLPSRMVDKAVTPMFLIMQRLRRGDPTDVVLDGAKKEGAFPVRHICLPAEEGDNINPPELRAKYVDGLMDPVRLGRRVLAAYKTHPYSYAGQYGQSPTPHGGGMFKRIYFSKRCKAAPYHAKRIRYWDRACLVESTLIETEHGPVPIKDVRVGDKVLTRQGYKRVNWSGQTKVVETLTSVEFSNGSVLTGTADHRVWTENRNWIELASLTETDYNVCISNHGEHTWADALTRNSKPLCSMEYATPARKVEGTSLLTDGMGWKEDKGMSPCIVQCGSTTRGRYQKDIISIMLTRIGITTTLVTSNASHQKNMQSGIQMRSSIKDRSIIQNIIGRHIRSWPSGGRTGRILRLNAFNAVVNSRQSTTNQSWSFTVPLYVPTDTIRTGKNESVYSVGNCFGLKAAELNSAPLCAMTDFSSLYVSSAGKNLSKASSIKSTVLKAAVLPSEGVPVYDLEVEDVHEFFANGILVHNSSTSESACFTAGVLLARDVESNYYVEDVVHGKWEPKERNDVMRATALKDRSRYGPKNEPAIWVEAEGGSSGRDAWMIVAKALDGFNVREDQVTGAKDVRAEPWSCQLAAGNVWLVDNGESSGGGKPAWDIEYYIQEHEFFRPEPGKKLGRLKDIVDSSSGAYNLLSGGKAGGRPLRTINLGKSIKGQIRVILCNREELSSLVIDNRSLLLSISNPVSGEPSELPVHGLNGLLDSLHLHFADLAPEEEQERWDDLIQPYNLPAEQLIMKPEHGKAIWRFLLKKREPSHEVIVIQDEGNRIGDSIAHGFCEISHVDPAIICYRPSEPEAVFDGSNINRHVVNIVKASRGAVIA